MTSALLYISFGIVVILLAVWTLTTDVLNKKEDE